MATPPLADGERVVRCLSGESVDRVPYGVGIGWWPWAAALERWRQESGNPDLVPARHFGFDASFVCPDVRLGLHPAFEARVLEESESFVISRNELGITVRNRRDGGSMPEFLDYPVKTPADWERVKEERLRIEDSSRVLQDWASFRALLARTGEAVQVGWFPYGVFGTPRDLLGAEGLLVGFYTEPAMIRDMMEHLTRLWLAVFDRVALEVRISHLHIWEDMSGRQGSLISPGMVRDFMMPCYDRIADWTRRHKVPLLSVDTDGDCHELVPIMASHGVNVFFPFEVQAGNDIRDYRARYPELGILGGLDKRALAAGKTEINREVRKAAEMVASGRYIPGFDHHIPPDVPWENYRYAAEALRGVCYGT